MICEVMSLLFLGSIAPLIWAWREMRHETKLAREIQGRAEAIDARAMRGLTYAIETRNEARRLRDQWKFAKISTDAIRPELCIECGIYFADPPSRVCPACEAYLGHNA